MGACAGPQQAAALAQTWLNNNWQAWQQNGGKMVEKYSAVTPGGACPAVRLLPGPSVLATGLWIQPGPDLIPCARSLGWRRRIRCADRRGLLHCLRASHSCCRGASHPVAALRCPSCLGCSNRLTDSVPQALAGQMGWCWTCCSSMDGTLQQRLQQRLHRACRPQHDSLRAAQ